MAAALIVRSTPLRYGISAASVLVVALILDLVSSRINTTTVALTLLLVVLTCATFFGRNPALLASFLAMLTFNYLFLPPVGTWHIADAQNLVAWAAFTITAIVAGELSAYARRRQRESERLYVELQAAFEKATQAEAFKQSEKLKSALLDAVTHDLRTPLTSIKASVTTLLDSEGGHRTIELDTAGRTEFLDIINEETDRLNKFIEGMVELARVEAGASQVNIADADVNEVVSIALDRAAAITSDHIVNVTIASDLPLVKADDRALAEVIYNLIENAVRYSRAGTTITVSATAKHGAAAIAVEDEGVGIPREERERVFEKFVRLDGGRADGMGLGLAIARSIVEAQNGTIEIVEPDNGVGTKIILTFPLNKL